MQHFESNQARKEAIKQHHYKNWMYLVQSAFALLLLSLSELLEYGSYSIYN